MVPLLTQCLSRLQQGEDVTQDWTACPSCRAGWLAYINKIHAANKPRQAPYVGKDQVVVDKDQVVDDKAQVEFDLQ